MPNVEKTPREKPKDGPFLQSLEKSLQQLHVQRQAYHGGTFVGNHVHKLFNTSTFVISLSPVMTSENLY